ncbi:hypothetical protein [Glaciihabitans sp. dw_435]|uniref:hypothetical protein n=1 Tax=Glaciihabitans sp. dw_435 TaxID=2720081 RepID=UPI001BD58348|nr:hypothetical protein [Glaciihabitans sp. dw_435]
MVKLPRFLRPAVTRPTDEAVQAMVYDLVREKFLHNLGPDGSFTITMRKKDDDDAFFSETLAETIAWAVASNLTLHTAATPTHIILPTTAPITVPTRLSA